jgi:hypothetical protein
LLAACESFARSPHFIPAITPIVYEIGDFIAVVPAQRSLELEQLGAEIVSAFDGFRAPLPGRALLSSNLCRLAAG